jgi:DNA polymerase-3 subunit epsilon
MKRNYKFHWLSVVSFFLPLFFLFGIVLLFWLYLTPAERLLLTGISQIRYIFLVSYAGLLMIGLGFSLVWIVHHYIIPTTRLAEEAELIRSGNLSHRIQPAGSPALRKLSEIINAWASTLESEQIDIETKITEARSESETQKNILAAFMAELPEGVLICNLKGKILLYNKQAKQFLAGRKDDDRLNRDQKPGSYQFVGLGRWVNDVVDPHLVQHALIEIKDKLEKKESDVAAYFVISQHGRMLRVEAAPILDHLRAFAGFVLIFYDITDQLQNDGRTQFLWQSLTRNVRSALTSIRSAIESLMDYPDMTAERRERLKQLIHTETLDLGKVLDDTTDEYGGCRTDNRWPLVFIKDDELLGIIKKRAAEKTGIELMVDGSLSVGWVRVDTYSITLAWLFILDRLKKTIGRNRFSIRLKRAGRFVGFDILWDGGPIKIENLNKWEGQAVKIGKEGLPFTLKEIMGYHHMDIGSYPGRSSTDPSHIRIFMPAFMVPEPNRKRGVAILPESRPEFFDFDIFHQSGQHPGMDSRRLTDLNYTVFDTETTGLDISGGDRIVSIGAVRIVNAKLLKEEQFDRLIDPGRPIPEASTEFHGITDDMVAGQPFIEEALPNFHRFADETVLVAHNAAFDMRLLQINERYTGIKFINPVLDTLLLSAVVHPSLGDHDLETLAKRLGVEVRDRHTALGDAITTASIFLKLLPLLAQRGIYTMRDARRASQQTYLARLKY